MRKWWLWGLVCMGLLGALILRMGMGAHESPNKGMPTPAQVDYWGYVLKGGVILSGIKTLSDLIDKLRRKK